MDAGIWAAAAAAIIMGGAEAAGTITVITKTFALASHCPGECRSFSDSNWPRFDAAS